MQPTPQRPEPPALGDSKPQWTNPSLPTGHAAEPADRFQFAGVDPRNIERRRRRRRSQLFRIYAAMIAIILLIAGLTAWQLVIRQQEQQQMQQPIPAGAQPTLPPRQ